MRVKVTLKDPQKECIDKITSDFSLQNNENTICSTCIQYNIRIFSI